jgi:hypothetical protein
MRDRTEGRRFTTYNTTLRDLLMMAYQLDPRQITGCASPNLRSAA